MRWSELLDQRARLVTELAKVGIRIDHLLLDLQSVQDPGIRAEVGKARGDREKLLKLALEWFGDLGNPQPVERGRWIGTDIDDVRIFSLLSAHEQPTFRTPDWPGGRLPPLDDDAPADTAPTAAKDKGGRPKVEISKDTLHEIFRQSLERARSATKPPRPSYQEIADDNGVGRTWVTPIVKWAVKHQREARDALRLSETPSRFSTYVRD